MTGSQPLAVRLSPETKLVSVVAFMIVVAITPRRHVVALLVDIAVIVGVLSWARVGIGVIAKRMLVIVPFIGLAALVPFVAGGDRIGPVSVEGLWAGWNILAKATIGVLASTWLAATTPMPRLLAALSALKVPPIMVAIAQMAVRYSQVLTAEFGRVRRAMTARGYQPKAYTDAKPLASVAGVMFVRSYERGERVHAAMLSRGYCGTMPNLDVTRSDGDHRNSRFDSMIAGLLPITAALALAASVALSKGAA